MFDAIEDEQANPGQNQGGQQDRDSQRGANRPRRDESDQDQRNRQKQDMPGKRGQGGQADEEEG